MSYQDILPTLEAIRECMYEYPVYTPTHEPIILKLCRSVCGFTTGCLT